MAGTTAQDFAGGVPYYLDPNQQDLLLAALASNNQDMNVNALFANMDTTKQPTNNAQFGYPADGFDSSFFTSPQQSTPANAFGSASIQDSPFDNYMDGDTGFDFDQDGDNGDLMIGSLPGDSPDGGEKRKSPDDDSVDDEGDAKRREGDDKQAKKPGRKPITSEPTTKRKAQNRAAQRAFRERKEKHLKDLETKVSELEKASDAANHENGLLRAQVTRLQTELREYRKRLSLNSSNQSRAPVLTGGFSGLPGNNAAAANNFQFDFPRFGGLPGGLIAGNKSNSFSSATAQTRQNSTGESASPGSKANRSAVQTPDHGTAISTSRNGSINGFFKGIDTNVTMDKDAQSSASSSTPQSRVFQFNSGSSTHSSPSASSNSQAAQDSSCDTSPEPSYDSPKNDTIADGYVCHGNSEGEIAFCEKLNMACGNPRNPVPRAMSKSDAKPPVVAPTKTPATDNNGFDFFASQNGGQFDPALFGDYRDSQSAIVGDGDFTGGFFNEAFPIADFGSPFHFGDTPAVQKPNPLEEIERIQDGDDEVVPGEDVSQMLNCHKIWDKLSNRPGFKDGTIDIDNLCSELRAKARCSESGVVVDHKDVEAALKRSPN